ncbi:hypothetical protein CL654_00705 [bacterium]|nr:hypothetical protein [bacterium]|tara:strand:- start:5802 stop:6239 length:438 start_codon:yes stop_codon:yes gene_type:complete
MKKVIIYTDGGARGNPGPAGAGAVIKDEEGNNLASLHKSFDTLTNNQAEYEAVVLGLLELKKLFGKEETQNLDIEVRADSELVVKQLNGEYQVKEEGLHPYFIKLWNMRVKDYPNVSFVHVPREQNTEADALANEAMDNLQSKLL